MTLFEKFTRIFGGQKDTKIAQLEAMNKSHAEENATLTGKIEAAEATNFQLLEDGEFRDNRIKELEAELAPFREFVAAHESDGDDGEAEAEPIPAEAG